MAGRISGIVGLSSTMTVGDLGLRSSVAWAQQSASGPAGSSAIVAAVGWLEGTLLGTVATVVAVLAVASVGLLMLGGRLSLRHGVRVVLGCFIVFGASSIAAGIHAFVTGGQAEAASVDRPALPEPPDYPIAPAHAPPVATPNSDPYAGATLPSG